VLHSTNNGCRSRENEIKIVTGKWLLRNVY
jgi:hypothetical protein